jgi:hypothetical protein
MSTIREKRKYNLLILFTEPQNLRGGNVLVPAFF